MEKRALLFKTLLVETENKEESFITEHPNSQLEIVSTDYRPWLKSYSQKSKEYKRKYYD
jgi:topoisomerase-4 subunit A